MAAVKEFFHCLRAALREVFRPEPFIDPTLSRPTRPQPSGPHGSGPADPIGGEDMTTNRTWDW
jgi:hypothetical protein